MTEKCIMLAAGGTGGHLFPASALARRLTEQGYNVFLLTDKRGARFIDKLGHETPYCIVKADTLRPGLLGKARSAMTIGQGYLKSFITIKRMRPMAIVGFGGYPSFPPVLAAAHNNVPVILHEQNAVLGKANRALAKYARHVALSFDKVDRLSQSLATKVIITGNPVREDIVTKADINYPDIKEDQSFFITVMGGSQGAHVFSDVVPKAMALLPKHLQEKINIVQQCRPEDIEKAKELYNLCSNITTRLEAFIDDVPDVLARAHLVITRAGASTVAELATIGRPAVFVPLPGSLEGDQAENAAGIADQGGGWVMPQDAFTAEALAQKIETFMRLPEKLVAAAKAIKSLGKPDADEKLARLVIETAEGK